MAGGRHAKPLLSNRIAIARVRQRLPVIVCELFEMSFDLSFRTVLGGSILSLRMPQVPFHGITKLYKLERLYQEIIVFDDW